MPIWSCRAGQTGPEQLSHREAPPRHRETPCCVMQVRASASVGGAVQQLAKMGDQECEPEPYLSYWR